MTALLFCWLLPVPTQDVKVSSVRELRTAVASAKPGTWILIQPGEYPGGLHFSNLHGAPGRTVVIGAADPARPPHFKGGGSGLQFSDVSYLEIRDLVVSGARGNGINIDDGATPETPSHHVLLRNLKVSDLPAGNHDGIKLSGLNDFRVENCTVARWGGSGIDMVGCHRGVITGCEFREGGSNAIQAKGGTSNILISQSIFRNPGQRGVNIGGSTGMAYFRPPIDKVPVGKRFEAKEIRVEGCTFVGGTAPIAFVGVDGARVRFNTIYNPERWVIRILQETSSPDFVPCRNGVFEDNLVVFRSHRWASGGVNIGGDTAPDTFRFARNFWFCEDAPNKSKPSLPTAETSGVYGRDPRLVPDKELEWLPKDAKALTVGRHAYKGNP